MSAALSLTEEQLEAMLVRAAEAGAMKAVSLMQGELKKRTKPKTTPVVIDDKTQSAANDALAARGLAEPRKRTK